MLRATNALVDEGLIRWVRGRGLFSADDDVIEAFKRKRQADRKRQALVRDQDLLAAELAADSVLCERGLVSGVGQAEIAVVHRGLDCVHSGRALAPATYSSLNL